MHSSMIKKILQLFYMFIFILRTQRKQTIKGTVAWYFYGYFLVWMDLSGPEREPLLVFKF